MKQLIIAIDGIDGTGKSTLAEALSKFFIDKDLRVKIAHASFSPEWNMDEYHTSMIESNILGYDVLILDRWIASEYAYGNAFRDGPSYDVFSKAKDMSELYDIVHVHAWNDKSIDNFIKLKAEREEMFDDSVKMEIARSKFNDFYYCLNLPTVSYNYITEDLDKWILDLNFAIQICRADDKHKQVTKLENNMSVLKTTKLTSAEKTEWEEKVKEGTFFLVGIEIGQKREGTYIEMVRHFNGNVKGIPDINKGMQNKGKWANRLFIEEFLKTQGDKILDGAPDYIIDDIALETGHLHKYMKDLFVDAFFKCQYQRIVSSVENWKTLKGVLNSMSHNLK